MSLTGGDRSTEMAQGFLHAMEEANGGRTGSHSLPTSLWLNTYLEEQIQHGR